VDARVWLTAAEADGGVAVAPRIPAASTPSASRRPAGVAIIMGPHTAVVRASPRSGIATGAPGANAAAEGTAESAITASAVAERTISSMGMTGRGVPRSSQNRPRMQQLESGTRRTEYRSSQAGSVGNTCLRSGAVRSILRAQHTL
jgi:hypothetical protein